MRDEAKGYGTGNRIEGPFEPGELVCLVEDVVTSGGAAAEAVEALREAGLECRDAVCVVDREEGGVDALARLGVRLRRALPCRRTARRGEKPPQTRMVEPNPTRLLGSWARVSDQSTNRRRGK